MKRPLITGVRFPLAGFTLVEIVIVLAIVAILVTLALPAYRSQVLRVHRSGAVNLLLQAAVCQERVYTRLGSYDTGVCLKENRQEHYQLSYRPANTRGQYFTAVATPLGAQKRDTCGSLLLDQNGNRGIGAAGVDIAQCWNGR